MIQEIKMKSTEFKPLNEFLLVKVEPAVNEETSNSGIVIQYRKSITQRPCSGTIIAVGLDCNDLSKGDYVVFPDTDGIDVKFLDSDLTKTYNEFMLLRYKSIIGKKAVLW